MKTVGQILTVGKEILTERQYDVLILSVAGYSDDRIALVLGVSAQRARRIRLRAYQKIEQEMTDATAA